MRGRAANRHYTAVAKKRQHPAAKCGNARCWVCHPHKHGNSKDRTKKKYFEIMAIAKAINGNGTRRMFEKMGIEVIEEARQ